MRRAAVSVAGLVAVAIIAVALLFVVAPSDPPRAVVADAGSAMDSAGVPSQPAEPAEERPATADDPIKTDQPLGAAREDTAAPAVRVVGADRPAEAPILRPVRSSRLDVDSDPRLPQADAADPDIVADRGFEGSPWHAIIPDWAEPPSADGESRAVAESALSSSRWADVDRADEAGAAEGPVAAADLTGEPDLSPQSPADPTPELAPTPRTSLDEAGEAPSAPAATAPSEASEPARTASVTAHVNMRAGPDNDAAVIRVIPAGEDVGVIGCDYWCEVNFEGERGWIYKDFVSGTGS